MYVAMLVVEYAPNINLCIKGSSYFVSFSQESKVNIAKRGQRPVYFFFFQMKGVGRGRGSMSEERVLYVLLYCGNGEKK